jgi:MFS family permease
MASPSAVRPASALSNVGFRWHLGTYMMAMMADNIEHVISYWMMYQKFHSASLGGFAVISHWLPFLLLSIPVGTLADRLDPRRMIQAGMVLFLLVSLGWAYFFVTDSLQIWQAMTLLVLHGMAGVLWQTSSQLLLHDIVTHADLASAVRLNATARYLGVLVGPAVGAALMLGLGANLGMLVNAAFYLPALLWLWRAPYGPKFRQGAVVVRRAIRSFGDVRTTLREIARQPVIVSMTVLVGATSFFVGNAYHAQMPGFAQDLGAGDPGAAYSMLLAADAAGALLGGFALEKFRVLRQNPRTALMLAIIWCLALAGFALTKHYLVALLLLFIAGFFELAFASMAQTLVQMNAPAPIRGSVIGVFNMAALGMRAFSGITVGLLGTAIGIHYSLAGSAVALLLIAMVLVWRFAEKPPAI